MFVLTSPFLDGWLAEFRPVAATGFLATDPGDRALLDFDLRLWRGALPENAREHRVTYWWRAILAEPEPDAEGREGHPIRRRLFSEMALCGKYARDPSCAGCPLRAWQGAPCGGQPDGEDAYERCARDPSPMIEALAAVAALLVECGESPRAVAGDGGVTERAAAWGQPVSPLTRERRAPFP